MSLLEAYHYPGNIRELKAIIQSAVNLSQGKPIAPDHLPATIQKIKSKSKITIPAGAAPIIPLAEVEHKHILTAYNQSDKNKSLTAELLGIGVNTLRRKLKSYGVE
jgi:two-component system response regulator AtoC